ncbi:molybdenum cofactor guanylyltransferase [Brevibacillus fluminis]|uniref:molybdenum cofactor guanylyltransferase n=1 Tax=Brevibacillus fluminis TaxID=511487 RepID=UPI003F8ACAEB
MKSMDSMCGVILAGGQSSRMGQRKELLGWGAETLIEHLVGCVRALSLPCLVVTNEPQLLPDSVTNDPQVQVSRDAVEPCGPLGGILTACRLRTEDRLLLLSCDLPFVTPAELEKLLACQASVEQWDVMVAQSQNRLHPLLGIYRRETKHLWESAYANRELKLMATLGKMRVHAVPEGVLDPWTTYNANTPAEYERALAEWSIRRQGEAK